MIKKILIANRGEIAVRVIRTCQELGIKTVAIFSEPDRRSLHVRLADEAACVGPAPAADSYLNVERILEVAREFEVDAIHPGYGFLAENAAFAEACIRAGIRFIGPPPEAIRLMGDKTAARQLMQQAGVPIPPGTTDPVASVEEALQVAREIGFPVLIKAAAGGGGKGMRMVSSEEELPAAFRAAQSEALSAFGDDRVYIEKYLQEPRHIEFQILADSHGQVVHLFERECSIQRRHQKVIEEAPAVIMTPELREKMGHAAVRAAQSCGYVNAGTVEFLVDADRNFYFMEMNTRLQVEHPVTEAITGIDLVAEQIRIAEGFPLRFSQEDLDIQGHAIEARIYAEDPANHFLPDTGKLIRYAAPNGPGTRVDGGVEQGDQIEIYYDPMIAKLIVHAEDREQAIRRMKRALSEYEIAGVKTTLPFCAFVMNHPAFVEGHFTTHFVETHFKPSEMYVRREEKAEQAAIVAVLYRALRERKETTVMQARNEERADACNPWWIQRKYSPSPLL